jgi:hypothetical protein
VEYDTINTRDVLGMGPEDMRGFETMVRGVVESFKENGYFTSEK